MMQKLNPFISPLQIICGKGGVGRSFIASFLADVLARRGEDVLLLELGHDAPSRLLGINPGTSEPLPTSIPHLWIARLHPEDALQEYALMILKFKPLYQLVFENRMVKSLLRSIPGLGSLTMLGKTWFHASEKLSSGKPRFRFVVVDAPATGHAIPFLTVARTVHDLIPGGPMKDAAAKMAEFLENPQNTAIHIVSLAEEMPLTEAQELVRVLGQKSRLPLGALILNRVSQQPLSSKEYELLRSMKLSSNSSIQNLIAERIGRDEQEKEAGRFLESLERPVFRMPEFSISDSGVCRELFDDLILQRENSMIEYLLKDEFL